VLKFAHVSPVVPTVYATAIRLYFIITLPGGMETHIIHCHEHEAYSGMLVFGFI